LRNAISFRLDKSHKKYVGYSSGPRGRLNTGSETFRNVSRQCQICLIEQGFGSKRGIRALVAHVPTRKCAATLYTSTAEQHKPRGVRGMPPAPREIDYSSAPAPMIFANIKGLTLRDVQVICDTTAASQDRYAIYASRVEDVFVAGFSAGSPTNHLPRDLRAHSGRRFSEPTPMRLLKKSIRRPG